jgi:AbiU2
MTAEADLIDIVSNGIILDIYEAEEALGLDWSFFGSVQRICVKSSYVALGRIFERPAARYKIRSIPAAIAVLRENAKSLTIYDRHRIESSIAKWGRPRSSLHALSDEDLTLLVAEEILARLPVDGQPQTNALSAAWDIVKTIRDKKIAHHEIAEPPGGTYEQLHLLLSFAKEFVSIIGLPYMRTAYCAADGVYFLTSDAETASRCMKRLLKQVGIETDKKPRI